ncbi:MAG: MoxR family ATPase [Bdellovibrionales bacterium]|nr:MoxR family ATPase [Bdellovibrionales bacterium]
MGVINRLTSLADSKPPEPVQKFLEIGGSVILGKKEQLELALCTVLARGHLLIEDIPGVGKTTLVKLIGKSLGLKESRIQFTNDMLPADILGSSIYDETQKKFVFHKGPLFGQIVIADELNRATPKTQSACLQAMEERFISVEGTEYELPNPFFMIATQNPREQIGTYMLPESQTDRFLMKIEMGYPDRDSERELLKGESRQKILKTLEPVLTPDQVVKIQDQVEAIHVSDAVIEYVQDVLKESRSYRGQYGLSPRSGLALVRAGKAWAYMQGRDMVLPEDIQAIGVPVMSHRLNAGGEMETGKGAQLAQEILGSVSVK